MDEKNLISNFIRSKRISMIDFNQRVLPVSVQAALLGPNRTSLYYKHALPDEHDLFIKREIDKIYTQHPYFGYRRITVWLKKYRGLIINRKAVLRHMREIGTQAIYPRHNTSKAEPADTIYPYLLKNLVIKYPDQVWSIDINYVPIHKNWLYLVVIIDWYSRFVVDWEIDDNLEIYFVLEACKNALKKSAPEIMNSDQGSHFTSRKYTNLFLESGSMISMDHRRAYDNIFIERLWHNVKYENIYLQDYQNPRETRIKALAIRPRLKYTTNNLFAFLKKIIPADGNYVKYADAPSMTAGP